MSGFLNSIGYVTRFPSRYTSKLNQITLTKTPINLDSSYPVSRIYQPIRRLRAPKRSPINTPTSQTGFFEPLPSPGAELSGPPLSPNNPAAGPKPLYLCQPFVKAALVKGSFKTIVAPPKYVDMNEWVAINCKLYTYSILSLHARAYSECV